MGESKSRFRASLGWEVRLVADQEQRALAAERLGAVGVARARARRLALPAQDVPILNFLLLLEHLQAAFYSEAAARARARVPAARALHGELLQFARVVAAQEQAHVSFLRQQLGAHARQRPTFAFRGATSDARQFAATALRLENLATGAYIGQGANLSRRSVGFAAGIASVEARQSGWLRDLLGLNPAPHAADPALAPAEVLTAILRTGFVKRA